MKPIEPGCLAKTVNMPGVRGLNDGILVQVLQLSAGSGKPSAVFHEAGQLWASPDRPEAIWLVQALSRPFRVAHLSLNLSKVPVCEVNLRRIDDIDDSTPDTLSTPLPNSLETA